MRTLISIMCHADAQDTFWRHFPYWKAHESEGADLLFWMPLDNAFKVLGQTIMASGKRGHDGLESIRRFYTIFEHMAKLDGYDQYALFEYDSFVLGQLPTVLPGTVIGNKFTEDSPAWKGKQFCHPPLFIHSDVMKKLVAQMGQTGFKEESGVWDRWYGYVLDKSSISSLSFMEDGKGFSSNTIEPSQFADLRRAIIKGAKCIHGVKTPECLAVINLAWRHRHMLEEITEAGDVLPK